MKIYRFIMMVQDIEKYMDYCRLFIGEKCAVTDEEIDEALNQLQICLPILINLKLRNV